MRLLLDTHAFLWYVTGSSELSSTAASLIGSSANTVYISIVSAWEVAIKVSVKKLSLDMPTDTYFEHYTNAYSFTWLPISFAAIRAVENLPLHHRDPLDRMLIAQATADSLQIVSADTAFDVYGVRKVW